MRTGHEEIINSRGFTLVEVLVAITILSIGLLGVAAMQTSSLKAGNSALYRSQAVFSAEEILDRMRANRGINAENIGLYEIELSVPAPGDWTTLVELENELGVLGYANMVLTDLAEWKLNLSRALPTGDGAIEINGNVATVVIRWTDSFGTEQVEMVTRL